MIAAVMSPRRIHHRYLLTPSYAAAAGPRLGLAGIAAALALDTFANKSLRRVKVPDKHCLREIVSVRRGQMNGQHLLLFSGAPHREPWWRMLPMTRCCPNCSHQMALETVHGVQLDVCPNCAGIWFNSDELRALLASDPKALSEVEATAIPHVGQERNGPSKMLCPDDQVLLEQYHYMYNSPILLHTCSTCGGLFVADGELGKMQQWYDQSHMPMTKAEQHKYNMAVDISEHQAFMMRQRHLQGLFSTLGAYRPGWFGFFP